MAIALVQSNSTTANNATGNITPTLSSQPANGALLVGCLGVRGSPYEDASSWPSGWVKLGLGGGQNTDSFNGGYIVLGARIVTSPAAQQALAITGANNYKRACIAEFSGLTILSVAQGTNPLVAAEENTAFGATRTSPSVVSPGREALIVGLAATGFTGGTLTSSDLTMIDRGPMSEGFGPAYFLGWRTELTPTTETAQFGGGQFDYNWADVIAVFSAPPAGRTQALVI